MTAPKTKSTWKKHGGTSTRMAFAPASKKPVSESKTVCWSAVDRLKVADGAR
jgi:hypothetical protein